MADAVRMVTERKGTKRYIYVTYRDGWFRTFTKDDKTRIVQGCGPDEFEPLWREAVKAQTTSPEGG